MKHKYHCYQQKTNDVYQLMSSKNTGTNSGAPSSSLKNVIPYKGTTTCPLLCTPQKWRPGSFLTLFTQVWWEENTFESVVCKMPAVINNETHLYNGGSGCAA